ncbi:MULTISPECIES: hypothetical protein [unclassified Variovorax]|uniref:hypothetical protein n=1 Tax=unclassified Variovorax TaxID=663243 RepID=UPI00076DDEB1|nr:MULTISPECIES: hypothetical protein [unclassified Variovorax]KWT84316.1 hypothetical protein APY03_4176 [Variovorax sp. WDL1]PNG52807.1 hypothetical protein CHC07_05183 [Variovorax sp. B4]PNG55344.1 hypothetical protein CHC06_04146 [Variovorax sp. B2]VTV09089.1 hypothetical protein WDL1CHR_00262 [Variovorax sp. WDL1]
MQRLFGGLVLAALLAAAGAAQAGWLAELGKASKTAGHAAPLSARLSKTQVLAASAGLGAGVVYVDVHGSRLFMELGDAAGHALASSTDDVADLVARVQPKGSAAPRRFVLSRESAANLGPNMKQLLGQGEVFVVEPTTGPLRVLGQVVSGRTSYFKQIYPGLLTPAESHIPTEVAQALAQSVKRERMQVAAMFAPSDVDSLRLMASAAGDRLLSADALVESALAHTLERMRGGVLVVVGHVEDTAFVLRGAGGETIRTLRFSELEDLAGASDVRIISAGCSSYCGGATAGFARQVTDVQMAEAIKGAFDADTTGALLGAFGKHEALLVDQAALEGFAKSRQLHLARLHLGSTAVKSGSLAVRLYAAARSPGRLLSIWEAMGPTYLLGAAASLVMFRTSRAAFLRSFPQLPTPELPQNHVRYIAARVGRILLYVALAPFFALAAAVFILLGGWAGREAFQAWLWRCIRHPATGLMEGLAFAALAAATILLYACAFALLFFPGAFMTVWIFGQQGTVLFWPLLVACVLYWILAVFAGVKTHKALSVRLSRRSALRASKRMMST